MLSIIAIMVSKIVKYIVQKTGRGATTIPGRIALLIKPNILKKLSKNVSVIIVTGTNGKTTNCRMIEEGLRTAKKSYFCNKSGANLITGITSAFIDNSNIFGKCKCEYALIECDENAFKKVSVYINPKTVLVTNIFRDQLDRFGEVSATLGAIKISLQNIQKTNLVLNADCSLTYSLARVNKNNNIIAFGVSQPLEWENNVNSDAVNCIFCKNEYKYRFHTFAHLGSFYCPKCGYHRVEPNVCAKKIINVSSNSTEVLFSILNNDYFGIVNIGGIYNVYNALSSIAVLKTLGISDNQCISSISSAECAFGRMEKFQYHNININIILVKNPTGFSQVISYLSMQKRSFSVCFCLNDNAADGRDVSWIWDVDYNKLLNEKTCLNNIYTCGKRCFDMALALKYSSAKDIEIKVIENSDYKELLNIVKNEKNDVYIVPSYTSMMQLRPLFAKEFGGKEFWE